MLKNAIRVEGWEIHLNRVAGWNAKNNEDDEERDNRVEGWTLNLNAPQASDGFSTSRKKSNLKPLYLG